MNAIDDVLNYRITKSWTEWMTAFDDARAELAALRAKAAEYDRIAELIDLGMGDPRCAEMTALHGAVICNQPSIVKFLIEQGAEVDAKNRLGWTPLMMAGGLYIANAHKTSPGSAQILREALAARGLNAR